MMGKASKTGFTIIEVTLFLAISGFLLAGLLAGTSASIARQRYTDSVQDFTEFLRRVYSETINVQNSRVGSIGDSDSCSVAGMVDNNSELIGTSNDTWTRWTEHTGTAVSDGYPGRSGCAIYGRLITFGENEEEIVRTYDIIGRTFSEELYCTEDLAGHATCSYADVTMDTLEALKAVHADIVTIHVDDHSGFPLCTFSAAGNTSSYSLQWQARAETVAEDHELFVGTVMIVRSPISGTVHTYVMEGTAIGANDVITNKDNRYALNISGDGDCKGQLSSFDRAKSEGRLLSKYLEDEDNDYFEMKEVNLCIGSTDIFAVSGLRRNIRLLSDGRNATAVELVAQDAAADEGGNQCL